MIIYKKILIILILIILIITITTITITKLFYFLPELHPHEIHMNETINTDVPILVQY